MSPDFLASFKADLEAFLQDRGLEFPHIEITTQAMRQHRDVIEIRVSSFIADSSSDSSDSSDSSPASSPEKTGVRRFFRGAND